MPEFLTIGQASKRTGRSTSTLRRFVRSIVQDDDHADRPLIRPTQAEIKRHTAAGVQYAYEISDELLRRAFPPEAAPAAEEGSGVDTHATTPLFATLQQTIHKLEEQLDRKDSQIERKDSQISELTERLRESHIMQNDMQKQLALAAPKAGTGATAIDAAPDEAARKKSSAPKKGRRGLFRWLRA